MLFEYPKKAEFGRIVPKSKIYERAKPSTKLRNQFVAELGQIVWKCKLAQETINLPPRSGVTEIQVFSLAARTSELSEAVLRCVDKTIPSPVVYEISFEEKVKVVVAYKRQSDSTPDEWVVDLYFESEWFPSNAKRKPLPVVLDMGSLYEAFICELIPYPSKHDESLRELVERMGTLYSKKSESEKLRRKIEAEKQFNRKVELNSQLNELVKQIDCLSSGIK